MPYLSIVMPCYNEEENIEAHIRNVIKTMNFFKEKNLISNKWLNYEIIVVDDGSTDKTKEILKKLKKEIPYLRVIEQPYNIGNGAAIKKGILEAKGEKILLMDSDGQHPIEEAYKLFKEKEKGYDLIVGARDPKTNASFVRRIANFCYNRLASYVTNFKIEDLTSGYRLFDKKTCLNFLYLFPNKFSYPTTMTLSYLKSGLSVKYVKMKFKKRKGISKINIIGDGSKFFVIILKVATFFSPLKIFIPTSTIFFFISLIYYIYQFMNHRIFPKISLLLFSISVMIFLMGLISEQIAQLRFENIQSKEIENFLKRKNYAENISSES